MAEYLIFAAPAVALAAGAMIVGAFYLGTYRPYQRRKKADAERRTAFSAHGQGTVSDYVGGYPAETSHGTIRRTVVDVDHNIRGYPTHREVSG